MDPEADGFGSENQPLQEWNPGMGYPGQGSINTLVNGGTNGQYGQLGNGVYSPDISGYQQLSPQLQQQYQQDVNQGYAQQQAALAQNGPADSPYKAQEDQNAQWGYNPTTSTGQAYTSWGGATTAPGSYQLTAAQAQANPQLAQALGNIQQYQTANSGFGALLGAANGRISGGGTSGEGGGGEDPAPSGSTGITGVTPQALQQGQGAGGLFGDSNTSSLSGSGQGMMSAPMGAPVGTGGLSAFTPQGQDQLSAYGQSQGIPPQYSPSGTSTGTGVMSYPGADSYPGTRGGTGIMNYGGGNDQSVWSNPDMQAFGHSQEQPSLAQAPVNNPGSVGPYAQQWPSTPYSPPASPPDFGGVINPTGVPYSPETNALSGNSTPWTPQSAGIAPAPLEAGTGLNFNARTGQSQFFSGNTSGGGYNSAPSSTGANLAPSGWGSADSGTGTPSSGNGNQNLDAPASSGISSPANDTFSSGGGNTGMPGQSNYGGTMPSFGQIAGDAYNNLSNTVQSGLRSFGIGTGAPSGLPSQANGSGIQNFGTGFDQGVFDNSPVNGFGTPGTIGNNSVAQTSKYLSQNSNGGMGGMNGNSFYGPLGTQQPSYQYGSTTPFSQRFTGSTSQSPFTQR